MDSHINRRQCFFARHINIVIALVLIFFLASNILVVSFAYYKLTSLSDACRALPLCASDKEATSIQHIESTIDDSPIYNIYTNSYTYAYMSGKHCITMGKGIYFLGEITPYGKLITATHNRLICQVSPNEYNVVYR